MSSPIPFVKYSGNGNDFIILRSWPSNFSEVLIARMCHRNFGIGADGVLLLLPEDGVDARMRIFNSDGGEAEMCANGLRSLVTYLDSLTTDKKTSYVIATMNAKYNVQKREKGFAIEMSEISDINQIDMSGQHHYRKVFTVNTGVPHLIFEVDKAKAIDIRKEAPPFRSHQFFPNGTNVSFLEVVDSTHQVAQVRTFERGVEDETFSCGTGLTASALALSHWYGWKGDIQLFTKGGEQLVSMGDKVFYSGEVTFCFKGEWTP
jgi:diaminopimelate epimerase